MLVCSYYVFILFFPRLTFSLLSSRLCLLVVSLLSICIHYLHRSGVYEGVCVLFAVSGYEGQRAARARTGPGEGRVVADNTAGCLRYVVL